MALAVELTSGATGGFLGKGGFGVVRRGVLKESGKPIAVKELDLAALQRQPARADTAACQLNFVQLGINSAYTFSRFRMIAGIVEQKTTVAVKDCHLVDRLRTIYACDWASREFFLP